MLPTKAIVQRKVKPASVSETERNIQLLFNGGYLVATEIILKDETKNLLFKITFWGRKDWADFFFILQ